MIFRCYLKDCSGTNTILSQCLTVTEPTDSSTEISLDEKYGWEFLSCKTCALVISHIREEKIISIWVMAKDSISSVPPF